MQGTGDYEYVQSLKCGNNIVFLSPRLDAYNEILDKGNIEYLGTRLHAGIRALQKGIRSFIIAIDNRSREMHKDFGIPIIDTEQINDLADIINKPYHIDLNIPYEDIERWKSQFSNI